MWLHFSLMYCSLEYVGYWSQAEDGWRSPALTTAKMQTPQSLSVVNYVFCFETNDKGVRSCHHGKVALKLLYLWDRPEGVYFLYCRNLSPGENSTKPVARIQGQSWFGGIRRCCIHSFVFPSYCVSRITSWWPRCLKYKRCACWRDSPWKIIVIFLFRK